MYQLLLLEKVNEVSPGAIMEQFFVSPSQTSRKNFKNYRFSGCPPDRLNLGMDVLGQVLGISLSYGSADQSGLSITTEASGRKTLSSVARCVRA